MGVHLVADSIPNLTLYNQTLNFFDWANNPIHSNYWIKLNLFKFFCFTPMKLDPFRLEFPEVWNLAGRRQKDASIEVHGGTEGVHYQAE